MSMEDILRAARKANGEQISKSSLEAPEKSPPPKYDRPKKWYEKHWLIWFLLIFLYPVGLMMLWAFSRYDKKVKTAITIATLALFLVGYGGEEFQRKSSLQSGSSYEVGYLKQGSSWEDETGKAHYNAKQVKVEIWKQEIITGNGGNLIQIYFLEGQNAGSWGYVRESALSR